MLVVVDTNVLVSGLLTADGSPARVVDKLVTRDIVTAYDDRILIEYQDVLHRSKFRFPTTIVEPLLDLIRAFGVHTTAVPLAIRLPDPSDLPFLEVAAASGAEYLISGNTRHFAPLTGSHGVTLVSPRQFLDLI